MTAIVNEAKHRGWFISKIRGMFEHRAEWLYLLLDEARKRGLEWESFAPDAVYRCGSFHGEELARAGGRDGSLVALRKRLFTGVGKRVFEMKVLKSDERELTVDFHYCPLVSAWQKQGASLEEIGRLCDISMRGDAGIAQSFGARLELGEVIAKGGRVCRVSFLRDGARA
jgi:L-2-amino-thiazoline-4-carboxylic acid hydrolase